MITTVTLANQVTASKTNEIITAVNTPVFTTYSETVYAPAAGSNFTIDLANGAVQQFITNANTTITLPATVMGKSYTVVIYYGGAHTITWAGGTSIRWAGGTAPVATSVNGKFDVYVFWCNGSVTLAGDGGRNY